jgi:hypothetical protein
MAQLPARHVPLIGSLFGWLKRPPPSLDALAWRDTRRSVRLLHALSAEDEYGQYIAIGISVLFGAQALINIAVAMSIFPTKGLTMPFVSYGGSSLLVCAAAMGILLSISRRSEASGNVRTFRDTLPAEASAMLVTEAGFSPEQVAKGRRRAEALS